MDIDLVQCGLRGATGDSSDSLGIARVFSAASFGIYALTNERQSKCCQTIGMANTFESQIDFLAVLSRRRVCGNEQPRNQLFFARAFGVSPRGNIR